MSNNFFNTARGFRIGDTILIFGNGTPDIVLSGQTIPDGALYINGDNFDGYQYDEGMASWELASVGITEAADLVYDNGASGLSATDVQAAIDELASAPLNNFVAVADPSVTDDSDAGYSVGSRWVNVNTNEAFVCLDASVGAADWKPSTAETASEIVYSNGVSNLLAENVQDAIDEVEGRVDTLESTPVGPLNKFDATAAPTANDDGNDSSGNGIFEVGSRWVDVTGDESYVCVDASTGAAVWKPTTADAGPLNNFAAVADPTATDDSNAGYSVGSRWVNTNTNEVYVCVDATAAAAVWEHSTSELASEIVYSNATSDLTATNVQDAIDEVEGRVDTLEIADHDATGVVTNPSPDGAIKSANGLLVDEKFTASFQGAGTADNFIATPAQTDFLVTGFTIDENTRVLIDGEVTEDFTLNIGLNTVVYTGPALSGGEAVDINLRSIQFQANDYEWDYSKSIVTSLKVNETTVNDEVHFIAFTTDTANLTTDINEWLNGRGQDGDPLTSGTEFIAVFLYSGANPQNISGNTTDTSSGNLAIASISDGFTSSVQVLGDASNETGDYLEAFWTLTKNNNLAFSVRDNLSNTVGNGTFNEISIPTTNAKFVIGSISESDDFGAFDATIDIDYSFGDAYGDTVVGTKTQTLFDTIDSTVYPAKPAEGVYRIIGEGKVDDIYVGQDDIIQVLADGSVSKRGRGIVQYEPEIVITGDAPNPDPLSKTANGNGPLGVHEELTETSETISTWQAYFDGVALNGDEVQFQFTDFVWDKSYSLKCSLRQSEVMAPDTAHFIVLTTDPDNLSVDFPEIFTPSGLPLTGFTSGTEALAIFVIGQFGFPLQPDELFGQVQLVGSTDNLTGKVLSDTLTEGVELSAGLNSIVPLTFDFGDDIFNINKKPVLTVQVGGVGPEVELTEGVTETFYDFDISSGVPKDLATDIDGKTVVVTRTDLVSETLLATPADYTLTLNADPTPDQITVNTVNPSDRINVYILDTNEFALGNNGSPIDDSITINGVGAGDIIKVYGYGFFEGENKQAPQQHVMQDTGGPGGDIPATNGVNQIHEFYLGIDGNDLVLGTQNNSLQSFSVVFNESDISDVTKDFTLGFGSIAVGELFGAPPPYTTEPTIDIDYIAGDANYVNAFTQDPSYLAFYTNFPPSFDAGVYQGAGIDGSVTPTASGVYESKKSQTVNSVRMDAGDLFVVKPDNRETVKLDMEKHNPDFILYTPSLLDGLSQYGETPYDDSEFRANSFEEAVVKSKRNKRLPIVIDSNIFETNLNLDVPAPRIKSFNDGSYSKYDLTNITVWSLDTWFNKSTKPLKSIDTTYESLIAVDEGVKIVYGETFPTVGYLQDYSDQIIIGNQTRVQGFIGFGFTTTNFAYFNSQPDTLLHTKADSFIEIYNNLSVFGTMTDYFLFWNEEWKNFRQTPGNREVFTNQFIEVFFNGSSGFSPKSGVVLDFKGDHWEQGLGDQGMFFKVSGDWDGVGARGLRFKYDFGIPNGNGEVFEPLVATKEEVTEGYWNGLRNLTAPKNNMPILIDWNLNQPLQVVVEAVDDTYVLINEINTDLDMIWAKEGNGGFDIANFIGILGITMSSKSERYDSGITWGDPSVDITINHINSIKQMGNTYIQWNDVVKVFGFGTYTAITGNGYFIDTNGGAFDMNLPKGIRVGQRVEFKDIGSNLGVANFTLNPDGTDNIEGANTSKIFATPDIHIIAVWSGSTNGWIFL